MILPTVQEISREQAVRLQREWQRAAAEQAKARESAASASGDRR